MLFSAKPVNSSSSNLELLLLFLNIVLGLILGACSLIRHAWHMAPYSINNCIDWLIIAGSFLEKMSENKCVEVESESRCLYS